MSKQEEFEFVKLALLKAFYNCEDEGLSHTLNRAITYFLKIMEDCGIPQDIE